MPLMSISGFSGVHVARSLHNVPAAAAAAAAASKHRAILAMKSAHTGQSLTIAPNIIAIKKVAPVAHRPVINAASCGLTGLQGGQGFEGR